MVRERRGRPMVTQKWPIGTRLRMTASFLSYSRGTVLEVIEYNSDLQHYKMRDDQGVVTPNWGLPDVYWELAEGPW